MFEIKSEIAPQSVLSVSELNREIKTLLETTIPILWIEGEISNLKFHSSGHVYFSLKDKESQISAVLWRSRNDQLFFTPQDGMKVHAYGKINVFLKRGDYQFDIIKLKPAGIGELQLAFEQLKQRLQEQGLFEEERKKTIPAFPETIGIVTSPSGAAIQDLLNILNRRFPGLEIIISPVKVQGQGAAHEIADAIDNFNNFGKVDLIIVGRGGGSLEDLWAFNEEIVARAIFRSTIPIISAVGHEVDFTISDFVADMIAPTPSAAAELAVANRDELRDRLFSLKKNMTEICLGKIQYERDQLKALTSSYHFMRTPDLIKENRQRIDELVRTMQLSGQHQISLLSRQVQSLAQRLQSLSPDSILKRGYSVCKRARDDVIVKDAKALKKEEQISVQFYRGKISGIVEDIQD